MRSARFRTCPRETDQVLFISFLLFLLLLLLLLVLVLFLFLFFFFSPCSF